MREIVIRRKALFLIALASAMLSGCAHNSSSIPGSGLAESVTVFMLRNHYVSDCKKKQERANVPGRMELQCRQEFKDNLELGKEAYRENKEYESLERQIQTYIEQQKTPDIEGDAVISGDILVTGESPELPESP